mmetsp:Transcript_39408/g.51580  ORF Transcript_39408/g.51580 Transcript_39408/m.51580 type:complete len:146 (+) Transcript_39408:16-453(+)
MCCMEHELRQKITLIGESVWALLQISFYLWVTTGLWDVDLLYKSFFITQITMTIAFAIWRGYEIKIGNENLISFDCVRSLLGVANVILMTFVFYAWRFYYNLVDGGALFFEVIAIGIYAHIVFWGCLMPLVCVSLLIKRKCDARR